MIDTTYAMFIETEVPENELIISRTDLKGVITYVNDTFAEISGYTPQELIGKAHNIVRHPDMPSSAFADVWETIEAGKTWKGYIKNMRKDRGYYWVEAEISGVYKDGKLVEYKSLRSPMTREKKIQMQQTYDKMRKEQEDQERVVVYLSSSQLEKLKAIL
jgi:aerotaxis receptor